jgi:hypothetical protein
MYRIGCLIAVVGLVLFACAADATAGGKKKVTLTKQWSGSVEDQALMKSAPEAITSQKALAKLWELWKIEGKVPEVDFTKEIVVSGVTVGSKINLAAVLNDAGNLQVLGLATRDIRPGFRYVLATVSRDGVKTVNGKELPKE